MLCIASVLGLRAQTDVTSTYLTNADFSSTASWTENHSASEYWALGNGLIGTYAVANNKTSTTDATHLETEYCLGIQCRWSTNYAYYTQTTTSLPVGAYTLTFDVENTNGSNNLTYENHFSVKVGENTYMDAKTEWMSGRSDWTTHTISFTLTEPTTATISLGYGTGSNNIGSGATPHLYVSHLKLTWMDPNAAVNAAKLEAAKYTLLGYIKKATAINSVLNNATLTNAIARAQTVYDNATDYNTHYQTVLSTIQQAKSAGNTALSNLTAVSLVNSDFNTTPNNTLNGDGTTSFGGTLSTSTSNPDNTKDFAANTGDHAYLYDVTGWTQYSKFNSTASQGTTSVYGTAMPANGWSTNSTTIPPTDMFGESEGAALHLSAGWNDQARYQQTVNSLPSGRYFLYYEAINQYSVTGIASNYIGVNGAAGDFYGTTNSFVYSDLKTFEQGEWKAQAFEFDVAKEANINFSVGVTTSTGGSGSGAKLWIDNVLVYRIGDVVVTTAEADAIIAEVEALDGAVYNAAKKSALAAAKTAFVNNQSIDKYNALNAALIAAKNSVEAYKALDKAIKNVEAWTATSAAQTIRTKYTNGQYEDDVTATSIYEEYQAAEIAALKSANKSNFTSVILNPSFETGDMAGWSAESRNDTGVKANSNGTYTINNGVDGNYIFNSWGGTAEANVYQTIKGLPAGTYTLTALLAGFVEEELVLSANDNTASVIVSGDKTTGNTVSLVFTLAQAGDVTIKASNTKGAESSDASFIKADNFILTVGDAMTNDYTALNNAISAAEAHTLGFDKNEYAPYKNVDALNALGQAKAVDQSISISQVILDGIVNGLTSATWTKNTKELDAIYDGQFVNTEANTTSGDINLPGWTKVQGIRLLVKDEATDPGLAYTNGKAAVFSWGGTTLTYGEQAGYTLPLNKGELYELTLKVSGWRDGDLPSWVEVKLDGVGEVANAQALGAKAINISEGNPFATLTFYLRPAADTDNSILTIYANKHFTIADLSLKMVSNGDANKLGDIVNSVLGKRQNYSGKSGATLSDVTKYVNKYLK